MTSIFQRLAGRHQWHWNRIKITGVKVLDIAEENAQAIEKMVNNAITEIQNQNIKILEIQTTTDNLILILGEKGE